MRPTQGPDFILYPLVGKEASGGFEDGSVMIHVRNISMATKCEGTGLESFGAYPCALRSLLAMRGQPMHDFRGRLSPGPAPGGTEARLRTSSRAHG